MKKINTVKQAMAPALLACCMLISSIVKADIVVIVNTQNDIEEMTRKEIAQMFMGKRVEFPNGEKVQLIDHAGSDTKNQFYEKILRKSEEKINRIWAYMMFTGKGYPPEVMVSGKDVVDVVSETPNALGYVHRDLLTDNVKVVYQVP